MWRRGKAGKATTRARIFILSEHPVICKGIRACLKSSRDLAFAGEASDAKAVRAFASNHRPDALLLDLTPPTRFCLTTITDLHRFLPRLPVLVFSTEHESLYAERALKAGAKGYVMEQAGCAAVLEAIQRVISGRIYLSPQLSEMLLEKLTGQPLQSNSQPLSVLSAREFDVFQMIGHGKDTQEMASRLHLSPKTIAVHRTHIRTKLKLRNHAQLVQFAIRFCEGNASIQETV